MCLLKGSGVGAATSKGNPLAAATMMRNMQNAAAVAATSPHPLNSINQMRLPQMGSPITSMASNLVQQPSGNSRSNSNSTKAAKNESKPPKTKVGVISAYLFPILQFLLFIVEMELASRSLRGLRLIILGTYSKPINVCLVCFYICEFWMSLLALMKTYRTHIYKVFLIYYLTIYISRFL